MGGLNSGPGPGTTLLIGIIFILIQIAQSAPLYEDEENPDGSPKAVIDSQGCYYNFQHYSEGERIITNEPCLNCTCRNRMFMCYLRVCPFTKEIGQNCTIEKVPDQCCPIITCPEVPVHLLTSTTTTEHSNGVKSPAVYQGYKDTAVGHLDRNGCTIDGVYYPNGAQVPGSPEKPCELCYCIRNKTACIMQECALHVDGCRPIYDDGQCFPVRYQCDDSSYEEEPTTTFRPPPTPGLVLTSTSAEPLECTYNNEYYQDGSRIQTEDPCEHCYCLKGKIACAVQECGAPLEKEGQNCTALPPAPGKCCPDSYQCDGQVIVKPQESSLSSDKKKKLENKHYETNDITLSSQDLESASGESLAGAKPSHPNGSEPDQSSKPNQPEQVASEGQGDLTRPEPTDSVSKQQYELEKGTQSHVDSYNIEQSLDQDGKNSTKTDSTTSVFDDRIVFTDPTDRPLDHKIVSEKKPFEPQTGHPGFGDHSTSISQSGNDTAHASSQGGGEKTNSFEASGVGSDGNIQHTGIGHGNLHRPPSSSQNESHLPSAVPEIETDSEQSSKDKSTQKKPPTAEETNVNNEVLYHETDSETPSYGSGHHTSEPSDDQSSSVKPGGQFVQEDIKDPLLNKLHNIIQDVQAQVNDGKTTKMPEESAYETTASSQQGHFTEKPDSLSHTQHSSQETQTLETDYTAKPDQAGVGNSPGTPQDSNDIINKLQGIIQGIYHQVTTTVLSTIRPEITMKPFEGDLPSSKPHKTEDNQQLSTAENEVPDKITHSEDDFHHKLSNTEFPVKESQTDTPQKTEYPSNTVTIATKKPQDEGSSSSNEPENVKEAPEKSQQVYNGQDFNVPSSMSELHDKSKPELHHPSTNYPNEAEQYPQEHKPSESDGVAVTGPSPALHPNTKEPESEYKPFSGTEQGISKQPEETTTAPPYVYEKPEDLQSHNYLSPGNIQPQKEVEGGQPHVQKPKPSEVDIVPQSTVYPGEATETATGLYPQNKRPTRPGYGAHTTNQPHLYQKPGTSQYHSHESESSQGQKPEFEGTIHGTGQPGQDKVQEKPQGFSEIPDKLQPTYDSISQDPGITGESHDSDEYSQTGENLLPTSQPSETGVTDEPYESTTKFPIDNKRPGFEQQKKPQAESIDKLKPEIQGTLFHEQAGTTDKLPTVSKDPLKHKPSHADADYTTVKASEEEATSTPLQGESGNNDYKPVFRPLDNIHQTTQDEIINDPYKTNTHSGPINVHNTEYPDNAEVTEKVEHYTSENPYQIESAFYPDKQRPHKPHKPLQPQGSKLPEQNENAQVSEVSTAFPGQLYESGNVKYPHETNKPDAGVKYPQNVPSDIPLETYGEQISSSHDGVTQYEEAPSSTDLAEPEYSTPSFHKESDKTSPSHPDVVGEYEYNKRKPSEPDSHIQITNFTEQGIKGQHTAPHPGEPLDNAEQPDTTTVKETEIGPSGTFSGHLSEVEHGQPHESVQFPDELNAQDHHTLKPTEGEDAAKFPESNKLAHEKKPSVSENQPHITKHPSAEDTDSSTGVGFASGEHEPIFPEKDSEEGKAPDQFNHPNMAGDNLLNSKPSKPSSSEHLPESDENNEYATESSLSETKRPLLYVTEASGEGLHESVDVNFPVQPEKENKISENTGSEQISPTVTEYTKKTETGGPLVSDKQPDDALNKFAHATQPPEESGTAQGLGEFQHEYKPSAGESNVQSTMYPEQEGTAKPDGSFTELYPYQKKPMRPWSKPQEDVTSTVEISTKYPEYETDHSTIVDKQHSSNVSKYPEISETTSAQITNNTPQSTGNYPELIGSQKIHSHGPEVDKPTEYESTNATETAEKHQDNNNNNNNNISPEHETSILEQDSSKPISGSLKPILTSQHDVYGTEHSAKPNDDGEFHTEAYFETPDEKGKPQDKNDHMQGTLQHEKQSLDTAKPSDASGQTIPGSTQQPHETSEKLGGINKYSGSEKNPQHAIEEADKKPTTDSYSDGKPHYTEYVKETTIQSLLNKPENSDTKPGSVKPHDSAENTGENSHVPYKPGTSNNIFSSDLYETTMKYTTEILNKVETLFGSTKDSEEKQDVTTEESVHPTLGPQVISLYPSEQSPTNQVFQSGGEEVAGAPQEVSGTVKYPSVISETPSNLPEEKPMDSKPESYTAVSSATEDVPSVTSQTYIKYDTKPLGSITPDSINAGSEKQKPVYNEEYPTTNQYDHTLANEKEKVATETESKYPDKTESTILSTNGPVESSGVLSSGTSFEKPENHLHDFEHPEDSESFGESDENEEEVNSNNTENPEETASELSLKPESNFENISSGTPNAVQEKINEKPLVSTANAEKTETYGNEYTTAYPNSAQVGGKPNEFNGELHPNRKRPVKPIQKPHETHETENFDKVKPVASSEAPEKLTEKPGDSGKLPEKHHSEVEYDADHPEYTPGKPHDFSEHPNDVHSTPSQGLGVTAGKPAEWTTEVYYQTPKPGQPEKKPYSENQGLEETTELLGGENISSDNSVHDEDTTNIDEGFGQHLHTTTHGVHFGQDDGNKKRPTLPGEDVTPSETHVSDSQPSTSRPENTTDSQYDPEKQFPESELSTIKENSFSTQGPTVSNAYENAEVHTNKHENLGLTDKGFSDVETTTTLSDAHKHPDGFKPSYTDKYPQVYEGDKSGLINSNLAYKPSKTQNPTERITLGTTSEYSDDVEATTMKGMTSETNSYTDQPSSGVKQDHKDFGKPSLTEEYSSKRPEIAGASESKPHESEGIETSSVTIGSTYLPQENYYPDESFHSGKNPNADYEYPGPVPLFDPSTSHPGTNLNADEINLQHSHHPTEERFPTTSTHRPNYSTEQFPKETEDKSTTSGEYLHSTTYHPQPQTNLPETNYPEKPASADLIHDTNLPTASFTVPHAEHNTVLKDPEDLRPSVTPSTHSGQDHQTFEPSHTGGFEQQKPAEGSKPHYTESSQASTLPYEKTKPGVDVVSTSDDKVTTENYPVKSSSHDEKHTTEHSYLTTESVEDFNFPSHGDNKYDENGKKPEIKVHTSTQGQEVMTEEPERFTDSDATISGKPSSSLAADDGNKSTAKLPGQEVIRETLATSTDLSSAQMHTTAQEQIFTTEEPTAHPDDFYLGQGLAATGHPNAEITTHHTKGTSQKKPDNKEKVPTGTPDSNDLINKLHSIIYGIQTQSDHTTTLKPSYSEYESTDTLFKPLDQNHYTDSKKKPNVSEETLVTDESPVTEQDKMTNTEQSSTAHKDFDFGSPSEEHQRPSEPLPNVYSTDHKQPQEHLVLSGSETTPAAKLPTETSSLDTSEYPSTPVAHPTKGSGTQGNQNEDLHMKYPEPESTGLIHEDAGKPTGAYTTKKPGSDHMIDSNSHHHYRPINEPQKTDKIESNLEGRPGFSQTQAPADYEEKPITLLPISNQTGSDADKVKLPGTTALYDAPETVYEQAVTQQYGNKDVTSDFTTTAASGTQVNNIEIKGTDKVPTLSPNIVFPESHFEGDNKNQPGDRIKPSEKPDEFNSFQYVTPEAGAEKLSTEFATDEPLHVVYPTYYPDGIMSLKPGTHYKENDTNKVTVTPQSVTEGKHTSTHDLSQLTPDADQPGYTIYEVHTQISSESGTTEPVVVVEEVHTEVHSERGTTESVKDKINEMYNTTTTGTIKPQPALYGDTLGPTADKHPASEHSVTLAPVQEQTTVKKLPGQTEDNRGTTAFESNESSDAYTPKPTSDSSEYETTSYSPHDEQQVTVEDKDKFNRPTFTETTENTEEKSTEFLYTTGAASQTEPDKHFPSTPLPHFENENANANAQDNNLPQKYPSRKPISKPESSTESESITAETQPPEGVNLKPIQENKPLVVDLDASNLNGVQRPVTEYPHSSSEEAYTEAEYHSKKPVLESGDSTTSSDLLITQSFEEPTKLPTEEGFSYVPYNIINGTKVYYPEKEVQKPVFSSDGSLPYSGYDYVPYKIVSGTKVFYPEKVETNKQPSTASHPLGMYVPYKIVNGNKIYYMEDRPGAEGYDGLDYVPFEIVDGKKVFHPEWIPTTTSAATTTTTTTPSHHASAMYVPYKLINGTKVFHPKDAQDRPFVKLNEYDGFELIPYDVIDGNKVFYPNKIVTATQPALPALYVPYKIVNGTKVYYPKHAQEKPKDTLGEFDGYSYIPYDIVNGKKVFRPEMAIAPQNFYKPSMYVPYKTIGGLKIYYIKDAEESPQTFSEKYDGFDLVPFEITDGTKIFHTPDNAPQLTSEPEVQGMFVPYKIMNGKKVYYPFLAQTDPSQIAQGNDGFDFVPYYIVNGTKIFRPDQIPESLQNKEYTFDYSKKPSPAGPSSPSSFDLPAMYIPFRIVNGTKVYYVNEAQFQPHHIAEGYDGFDYVPYNYVNGNKVFYPDKILPKPSQAMYVPYKIINGTKIYYPKDANHRYQSLAPEYEGVDYVPYELINGTRVFYPDRVKISEPSAMYVPFKIINGSKVYYPQAAKYQPQHVFEDYDGFDYVPFDIENGTKVFHPEKIVSQKPSHTQGMYVPYKIINGTKFYNPKEAQTRPHPLSDEYHGLDYLPLETINETKTFIPEKASGKPETQSLYVPFKFINGNKVYYPNDAHSNPQQIPDTFDGFDYLPYKIVDGQKIFQTEHSVEPMFFLALFVPYKIINNTKVFYPKDAQEKPEQIPSEYNGFEYIPYEVIDGKKVFRPEQAIMSPMHVPASFSQALYVPYKIINGTKVYYTKHAAATPQQIPKEYDGFDYVPYEVVDGKKIFHPEKAASPVAKQPQADQTLYVPYKIINGTKVYYPKHAQEHSGQWPNGYDGIDRIPYEIVDGKKVFHPEQVIESSTGPWTTALYVPYKIVNGTKVFYPKHAQQQQFKQLPQGYDGAELIPYEIIDGKKVFHPEQAVKPATSSAHEVQALYVPYKIVNGTKVYYTMYAVSKPQDIKDGYDGFDYIPYKVINGNKVFHPEEAIKQVTAKQPLLYMSVPYKLVNGAKVFYPKDAKPHPEQIPHGYDGSEYIPYDVMDGKKVFYPELAASPVSAVIPLLEGTFIPFKLSNGTKVFYPVNAQEYPKPVPQGFDGSDYVPFEVINGSKIFYPELISIPINGAPGVYIPYKFLNGKKVFSPEAASINFPINGVKAPYAGVAYVPYKIENEYSEKQPAFHGNSQVVYIDDHDETFKPHRPQGQTAIPGEGSCLLNRKTFTNNSDIPPFNPCQARCKCVSSIVQCVRVKCPSPPQDSTLKCSPVYQEGSCCPTYSCENPDLSSGLTSISAEDHKTHNHTVGHVSGTKSKPDEQKQPDAFHIQKPYKSKPGQHEPIEPYDPVEGEVPYDLTPDDEYDVDEEEPYGPGTCRYAGKVYVSAQQIPRDDPCDFCFCFRSDIICLQQSCPPPIPGCRDEPIQGFCCPRYECHVKMATVLNVTSTTTTTTTTLPPHFFSHAYKGSALRTGCFVQGKAYRVGQPIPSASGPCMDCNCGGNGRMKCEPKVCTPEPLIRKMIAPTENSTPLSEER